MEVSNKVLVKSLFIIILLAFITGIIIFGLMLVSYEAFYAKYMAVYSINAKYDLLYFRIGWAVEIVAIIAFIPVLILIIKYFKRTNKLIRHIKEYRDYMVSTNNYKIEDISKEFNEEPRIVETTIQKAINKHILKNVYLSKQTKEVLLVNKKSVFNKSKCSQQNVNVENNVIINDKSE